MRISIEYSISRYEDYVHVWFDIYSTRGEGFFEYAYYLGFDISDHLPTSCDLFN